MTNPSDAYWDELGIAWRAVNPDLSVIAPRLRLRLRWQALCANALIGAGIPLSVAALALGVFTIWRGFSADAWNFVTRGIAIAVMAFLLALVSWFQRIGARALTGTLSQMIDLAILRVQKLRQAAVLGIYICAVAIAFGVLGYLIRRHIAQAPAMSPWEPSGLLVVGSVALMFYVRRAADELKRLRYLKSCLLLTEGGG